MSNRKHIRNHNGVNIERCSEDYFHALGQRFHSVNDAVRYIDLMRSGKTSEAMALRVRH